VPPDFREPIESLGLPVTPIGPELRKFAASTPSAPLGLPSAELRRQLVDGTVATQFETITAAAEGCDVIVGATDLQVAGPSIPELMGIPYVFAAYCRSFCPRHHALPVAHAGTLRHRRRRTTERRLGMPGVETRSAPRSMRIASLGLAPVSDVRRHMFTGQLAAPADACAG
jgi:vancomycin aglycone glucosyltransferase